MIDTHAHLNFAEYNNDLIDVIHNMQVAGVSNAIVVGTDIASSKRAIELAQANSALYAAIGVHPGDINEPTSSLMSEIESLVLDKKVVAIGEVGLDYKIFNDTEPNKHAQQELFEQSIVLANNHTLPLIVHSRLAEQEVVDTLKRFKPEGGAVVHCFSGSYEVAKQALDNGLFVSFTAMLTYPKNNELREVAKRMPHDRVMIETDCPFLPPQTKRGQRNEPANVGEVAHVLADLWQVDVDYVDKITTLNAKQFFGI